MAPSLILFEHSNWRLILTISNASSQHYLLTNHSLHLEATITLTLKTPIGKRGISRWGILKSPVIDVLNYKGWIK